MSVAYSTGSSLTGYPSIAEAQRERFDAHTLIDVDDVYDASVRKALLTFDGALEISSSVELAGWSGVREGVNVVTIFALPFGGPPSRTFTWVGHREGAVDDTASLNDAVATIDLLADELGVPVGHILKAAGVKRRTYYSWKNVPGRNPRVASQGALWSFAQTVEDLRDELGSRLRQWVHSSPARLAAIREGNPDELIALLWSQDTQVQRPDTTARSSGLAEDIAIPKSDEKVSITRKTAQRVSLHARQPD